MPWRFMSSLTVKIWSDPYLPSLPANLVHIQLNPVLLIPSSRILVLTTFIIVPTVPILVSKALILVPNILLVVPTSLILVHTVKSSMLVHQDLIVALPVNIRARLYPIQVQVLFFNHFPGLSTIHIWKTERRMDMDKIQFGNLDLLTHGLINHCKYHLFYFSYIMFKYILLSWKFYFLLIFFCYCSGRVGQVLFLKPFIMAARRQNKDNMWHASDKFEAVIITMITNWGAPMPAKTMQNFSNILFAKFVAAPINSAKNLSPLFFAKFLHLFSQKCLRNFRFFR